MPVPWHFGRGYTALGNALISMATLPMAGRGGGEAGGGSHSSGCDTSDDQGHGNSQHGKRKTQAQCCSSGALSGAACCCPDTMWSSICAFVAAPAVGHVLCSSRSPLCCLQGDSPAALPCPCQTGSWCPGYPGDSIVRDGEGPGGEGISCGAATLCLGWDCQRQPQSPCPESEQG